MSKRVSLLVTVKGYPAVSTKYGEAVCVAGVRTDQSKPEWVRLFPVEYRDLGWTSAFKKYEHISVEAIKHSTDQRPETYRPDMATLERGEILDTRKKDGWERRRALVEQLEVESMCEVLRRQELDGTSLGVFRPADVIDLVIEDAEPWSPRQDMVAHQPSLLYQNKATLERIPYRFSYRYSCGPNCRVRHGHKQSIIDWEIAQAFREWRYDEPERLGKIREHWMDKLCGADRDTFFYVGNTHVHQRSFMVLGVFWPPKPKPA
jgi:hypothetical protein